MNARGIVRAGSLAIAVAACSTAPSASFVAPMPSPVTSPSTTPDVAPTASAPAVEPTLTPLPTDVPATSAWSQNPPEPLLIGAAVRVLATELNIRDEPSTSAKRVETFRARQLIIVDGLPPVDANGYTWYHGAGPYGDGKGNLLPLPDPADAGVDATSGWFAATKGAVPYVEPAASRCPTVVDLRNLGAMTPGERLDCFGGRTIEFEGTYGCPYCIPEIYGDYAPNWLASPNVVNLLSVVGTNLGGRGLSVRFPPTMDGRPETAAILRVRGHFDDPRSSDCSITLVPWNYTPMVAHPVPGSIARLWCRQMFVLESYEITGTDASYDPDR
jgi:hypothetical protein